MLVGVQAHGHVNLVEIGRAADGSRFCFRHAQGRQQQGGQNANDRDHDQQLDQGERLAVQCIPPDPMDMGNYCAPDSVCRAIYRETNGASKRLIYGRKKVATL